MKRKILLALSALLIITMTLESCKAGKGCGCGNNLNHYNPKKGR